MLETKDILETINMIDNENLAVLLAAAGLFFVLDATLFRVKTIDLDGLRTITREHVIEVAGLRGSIGFFSVAAKRQTAFFLANAITTE